MCCGDAWGWNWRVWRGEAAAAGRQQVVWSVGCVLRTVHTGEVEHKWVRGELGERPAQGGFVWLAPKNVQKELGSWGCSSRSRATDTLTSQPFSHWRAS